MHSDIIKEDEKHSNHSPVIMLLCLPYTREGDYIRINGAVTTVDIWERNKELIRKRTDIGEHFTWEII